MAIILAGGGQSSSAVNGQSTTYIVGKILQQMPAAPDGLVNSVLQDVLREFYTNTAAWREIIGGYALVTNRDTVQLNPVDQYSKLQYVLQAWLYPAQPGSNTRQFLAPSTRKILGTDVGMPSSYWMENPDTLHFYPVPDQSYGNILYVYGAMLPLVNTTMLPNVATTHHLDALQFGVLERLYRMPGRPWTNFQLSKEFRNYYKQEKNRQRDVANRAFTTAENTFRFPAFAGRYIGSSGGSENRF